MKLGDKRRFQHDPFAYIENLRQRSSAAVIRLPWGGWCVSDADMAQVLLRSHEFNADMSGFFGELLATRTAQVAVGQSVRNTLRARMPEYRDALATAVDELPAASRWPTAGTELVYRCLADVLLDPQTPDRTRRLVDRAVSDGVVFRPLHLWQRARAEILRGKLIAAITEQVAHRRHNQLAEPPDVLDAVLGACPDELDRTVAKLYLVLLRSIVAPVSSSLAWSVLLACLHHTADSPWPWSADWVAREALRHRPMVWMVGRTIGYATEFGGISFQPGDVLSVSPYLLHHDEKLWADPGAFRPERWAQQEGRGPYIPFGSGPFICAGASVAHTFITEALTALTSNARLAVAGGDARPVMVEGAVPRPFTVHRTRPNPQRWKGGDQP
jgi:cytochrome P450